MLLGMHGEFPDPNLEYKLEPGDKCLLQTSFNLRALGHPREMMA